jgi:hypothetical protein
VNETAALEAQNRLNKALEDEAKAQKKGDPVAVAEANSRKRQAEDDLYRLDNPVEEEVVLVSPIGITEAMPRSQAERMVQEFPGYTIGGMHREPHC